MIYKLVLLVVCASDFEDVHLYGIQHKMQY